MNIIHTHGAGLDVHKKTVVAAIAVPGPKRSWSQETQTFGTMTAELLVLSDWLLAYGVTHVAMESTGEYSKPVFNMLESDFHVVLVNAQHIKAVPGRKTDVNDAEWIADLLKHGLLKASFVPPRGQRERHELTRHRSTFVRAVPVSSTACRRCWRVPTSNWPVWPQMCWGSRVEPCWRPSWRGMRALPNWPNWPRAACARNAAVDESLGGARASPSSVCPDRTLVPD